MLIVPNNTGYFCASGFCSCSLTWCKIFPERNNGYQIKVSAIPLRRVVITGGITMSVRLNSYRFQRRLYAMILVNMARVYDPSQIVEAIDKTPIEGVKRDLNDLRYYASAEDLADPIVQAFICKMEQRIYGNWGGRPSQTA